MRHGEHSHDNHGHGRHGRHRDGHKGERHRHSGAQTFRRGRALDFLRRLTIKRDTLIAQLDQPELQSIHQVISGELKAVELIRNEFIDLFELHEIEDVEEDGTTAPVGERASREDGKRLEQSHDL